MIMILMMIQHGDLVRAEVMNLAAAIHGRGVMIMGPRHLGMRTTIQDGGAIPLGETMEPRGHMGHLVYRCGLRGQRLRE